MNSLNYEDHVKFYRNLFAISPERDDENAIAADQQAQHTHSLVIFDALRECFTDTAQVAQRLTNEQAGFYLLYGASRRLGMMFYAYQDITLTVHPTRSQPLPHEDQQRLTLDLNVLYMHMRGVLDNLAWSLVYEKHPDKAAKIVRRQVDLFHRDFRKACPSITSIAEDLDRHADWNRDVKERRDPVAHRIPLYMPSAEVTEDEGERYGALHQRFINLAAVHDFAGSDEAFNAIDTIGRFVPYFLHHPREGRIPIYPTVPTDMAHTIQIVSTVKTAILRTP